MLRDGVYLLPASPERLDACERQAAVVGGTEFTHVGERVTFEVLVDSFALGDDDALRRIAALVHYMDVGGIPVPEATGLMTVLTGARLRLPDHNGFLAHAGTLFDDVYRGHGADATQ